VPGVPLLIAGWIIGKRWCQWTSTDSEVFTAGRYRGLRWTDNTNTSRQDLLQPEEAPETNPFSPNPLRCLGPAATRNTPR